jgi:hypothetical protein
MTIHRDARSLADDKTWEAPVISDARLEWEEPKLQRLAGRNAMVGGNATNDGNTNNFS